MIDANLRAAYRDTRYVVADDAATVVLEIDCPSPALDRLLRERSVDTAAFVTAWNPRSRWCPPETNHSRAALLKSGVRTMGFAFLPVTAIAKDPEWTEQGLLVLGIAEAAAQLLGRAFDQNAIVFAIRGAAPRLVDLVSPAAIS